MSKTQVIKRQNIQQRQSLQQQWAEENFGRCRLGDARRTRRLVQTAELILNNPAAALASLDGQWKNTKGAYRLFGNENVTFEAIMEPHCENTRKSIQGKHSLIICDTSDVVFGNDREIEQCGDLGHRGGAGFLLHPAMAVDANSGTLQGLAGAVIRHRQRAPKDESSAQRKKRERESAIWTDAIRQVGEPGEGTRYTTVCDRGADCFEILAHLVEYRHDYVVRTSHRHRVIRPFGEEEKCQLRQFMERQDVSGTYEVTLRSRKDAQEKKSASRVAKLEVRIGKILFPAPTHKSRYEKECGIEAIETHVVWAREVDCPKGCEALEISTSITG